MFKLGFIICTIILILTVWLSQPAEYIGNTFSTDKGTAICTPKGWIIVYDNSLIKKMKNKYLNDGLYGKNLKEAK